MAHQLSIRKAILYSVNAVVSDPWYFVKLWLMWIAILFVPLIIGLPLLVFVTSLMPLAGLIVAFLALCTGISIWFLPSKLLLNFYDYESKNLSLRHIFKLFRLGLMCKLFIAFILYTLLLMAGLILLIIPGVFVAIRCGFVFLRLIDTDCSILEAFRKSYEITKGNFWRLCGLVILVKCLMYLIITVPVALLMFIHAYRQLQPAGK